MENIKENENVVRLAKPQRKGILRLIFSRFLLIFLLLALEVGLIIYGFYFLDDKFPNLVYIWRLFSVLMIIYLFNCPMDSSAKLSWMLLISFLPFLCSGKTAGPFSRVPSYGSALQNPARKPERIFPHIRRREAPPAPHSHRRPPPPPWRCGGR